MIHTTLSSFLALRNRHFLLLDLLIFMVAPTIALAIGKGSLSVFADYPRSILTITLIFLLIKLLCFYATRIYTIYWSYASIGELGHVLGVLLLVVIVQTIVFVTILRPLNWIHPDLSSALPLVEGLLVLLLVGMPRYSVRLANKLVHQRARTSGNQRILVAGAGEAGVMIVQELLQNGQLGLTPVAFIDDDPQKLGLRIRGLYVLGDQHAIPALVAKLRIDLVIIAMPTAPGKVIREIVSICVQARVQTRIIPGIYELLGNTVSVNQIRNVQIEDLLRRDPVQTNTTAICDLLRGKRVLVSGGGGSIGSELCRQILRCEPAELIVLGHGENSVFELSNELHRQIAAQGDRATAACKVASVIADIRFPERLYAIFEQHRPQVVFHAAAHKHVPLMEQNPSEALTNNIFGTRNLLNAALASNVEHLVMISSDKAVNPTSIMGASKRVAEYLVHKAARASGKPFVVVRFGNVLGSRGSVVLTFKQQIAAGGPITITSPEMQRFFMTIPEAVQLVLQAAVLGHSGEVFMLDMGEPVKIVDLAQDMIKLSGLQVGHDIDIVFTGTRPGEKLYEELFLPGEAYQRTIHEKIFIASNASAGIPATLNRDLWHLEAIAQRGDKPALVASLKSLVPEFQPDGDVEAVISPPGSRELMPIQAV